MSSPLSRTQSFEDKPRVALDEDELDAVLNDMPLPERIAHRTSRRPQTAKPARKLQIHTRPMGEPTEVGLQSEIEYTQDNRVVQREVKASNNFVKKRYVKQLHAISFAGQQYDSEVMYDERPSKLAPLVSMFKHLAVGESGIKSRRPRTAHPRSTAGRGSAAGRALKLNMWIPHTVVYRDADQPSWIYSNAHGEVCKTTNFTEKHVLESLGDLANEQKPVVVLKKPSWDHKESNELSLLNSNDLCSLLQRAGAGGLVCVQQLVQPKGLKASLTRCMWRSGAAPLAWQITNRYYYDDNSVDPRERLCTHTQQMDSCTIFEQKGNAIDEYAELCNRVVQFLEKSLTPTGSVRFSQMVCDFVKDDSGRIWLLQVKAFQQELQGVPRLVSSPNDSDENVDDLPIVSQLVQRRAEYKKMTRCFSCLVPYTLEDLPFQMTAQMVKVTEEHMRRRGQACDWFDRPSFSTLYEAHSVCPRCFSLYKAEQELSQVEVKFASSIGVPVDKEATLLTGSDVRHSSCVEGASLRQSMAPPPKIDMYRFFVFINELRELPSLESLSLEPGSELVLEFRLLGLLTRIPLPLVPAAGGKLRVHKLRTFHFFLKSNAELKQWLLNLHHVDLLLCVSKPHYQVLGKASLPTRLFRGQPVVKVDYAQLFGSVRLQTTTLRATLGVVHYGEFDTSLLKLQFLEGAWQPDPDFYTCDALPREWIELFTQLNRTGAVQSPNRLRPPSAREFFVRGGPGEADTQELEAAAPSPLSSRSDVPQMWTLQVHVDNLCNGEFDIEDEWWIEFDFFGSHFESFKARSGTCNMPIEFNSLHRQQLRASADALEEVLKKQDCLELHVYSKLTSGSGGGKSVTIGLQGLMRQGVLLQGVLQSVLSSWWWQKLTGSYDVLTVSPTETDELDEGDQLNLEVTLQQLQISDHQLAQPPSPQVERVVGPGVEVVRDLGTAPTLNLSDVEERHFDDQRSTGPREHGIGHDTKNDVF